MIVHKRKIGSPNDTACGKEGAKTYLSSQVTCPECYLGNCSVCKQPLYKCEHGYANYVQEKIAGGLDT